MDNTADFGLAIPESDQEFVILPDKVKVRFESTGPLMKYLDEEIAAWKSIDASISSRYVAAKNKLQTIVNGAGGAKLADKAIGPVKNDLCSIAPNGFAINTCISSVSKLGKYLADLRARCANQNEYANRASAAFYVALRLQRFPYQVGPDWMLTAADAAARFYGGSSVSGDIPDYQKELESLAALGVQQRTDYDNRIADFEAKKTAFDADRKKQFEDDNAKFAEHLKAADDSAEEFRQKYQERIKVLEDTYHKKLQLEAPAEYWDKLAKSYLCRGWIFMSIAFLSGAVVFGWLMALLMDAECLPLFEHTKFDAATIRASLIFVALMSVAGYLIHLFTRIAISSFHLSRDYRERFQLTRVYLALIKSGGVANDENTRQIVLQSIFSRSDTGLLKGDHALTMPVAAIGELAKS